MKRVYYFWYKLRSNGYPGLSAGGKLQTNEEINQKIRDYTSLFYATLEETPSWVINSVETLNVELEPN